MRGMSQKHHFTRRAIVMLGSLTAGALLTTLCILPRQLRAQTKAADTSPAATRDLVGTWQGTLHAGKDLRTVVKVSKDEKGAYKANFYSIDQVPQPLPVDSITLDGSTVNMELKMIGGKFEGKLSADGNTIDGQWSQGPAQLRKPNGQFPSPRRRCLPWRLTQIPRWKWLPSSPAFPAGKARALGSGAANSKP
jgi:hypothetical protein